FIVGLKNQGKTTVTRELIRTLSGQETRVLALKHSSHNHPVDKPGSDSDQFRRAGAILSVFQSPDGTGLYLSPENENLLHSIWPAILDQIDLIIVESFSQAEGPKLLVARDKIPEPLPNGIIATISQEEILPGVPYFPGVSEGLIDFLKKALDF
ncbi:MAG: molybdopterin-guanine dinucleotide biosynthesis protein B, partial [Methanobacteriota archaeon]